MSCEFCGQAFTSLVAGIFSLGYFILVLVLQIFLGLVKSIKRKND